MEPDFVETNFVSTQNTNHAHVAALETEKQEAHHQEEADLLAEALHQKDQKVHPKIDLGVLLENPHEVQDDPQVLVDQEVQ